MARCLAALILLLSVLCGEARSLGEDHELLVGVYLPGVLFARLDGRAELGAEIAAHLGRALGRRASYRVYATAEALENDSARISVALVEAPYVVVRLGTLTPLCAVSLDGKEETRLMVMALPSVKNAADLKERRLAFASLPQQDQAFVLRFLFRGELVVPEALREPARDASSALSKISLKKAEAVLLYEPDAASVRHSRVSPVYISSRLPGPTLVTFDRRPEMAQLLREALSRFSGRSHRWLRRFHPTSAARYETLLLRSERPHVLPPMLELGVDDAPLRLPKATSSPLPAPPLKVYEPAIE